MVHNACSKKASQSNLINTPDQDAIIQLAKENKKGITLDNTRTMFDWAKEYDLVSRLDLNGHNRGNTISRGPHAHFGPVNHIPILK